MFALARAGLADPANYQAFRQLLDVDDFILYMLVQFYVENVDWDASNWYAARNRVAPGGFHFFNWDGEQSLISRDINVTAFDPAVSTGKPRELWAALRMQPDFMARLQKQADALMTGDGALTPARALALFDRRISEIRPAMPLEAARWGRYRRPEQPYGMADFEAEVTRLRTTWFPGRTQIVREQVR
jgi:hypothetical protein